MKPFGNLVQKLLQMSYVKSHRKDINKWELGSVVFLLLMILCLLNFAVVQMVCKLTEHPSGKNKSWKDQHTTTCDDPCRFVLAETVPDGLVYAENATGYQSIYNSWMNLINMANSNLDIASFYWTLTGSDINVTDPTSKYGEIILDELGKLPSKRVNVRVASSMLKFPHQFSTDLKILKEKGIQIREVNFEKIMHGVLHSKLWIVDNKHIYIGSANMDWRALTQVKELGAVIYNCSCLANDFAKIFEAYWSLGLPNATIPTPWPPSYSTKINKETPLSVKLNGTAAKVYFSSSPPRICPKGRTTDLDAILSGINAAKQFLYVSVMEYFPTSRFLRHVLYWPLIDDSLRKAAIERCVHIQLLVAYWKHSDKSMLAYLQSLQALRNIKKVHFEVKLFIVPVGKFSNIPYARVSHAKYFVTENIAYIGTSNWSYDYFNSTTGVGLLINQTSGDKEGADNTVHHQLKSLFQRDWNSNYSITLDDLKDDPDFSVKLMD
ncbi:5'-3' exonuclease PLD3-like [Pristis pectinata]|uniref:5'-3' exonuclease PLD3-like n=1 Tax=Pristis pectinata TaxID=685728 RepID=UPI00223CFACB|nr:5'-3' exonuclease PLD3-like [Pristis pectinata]